MTQDSGPRGIWQAKEMDISNLWAGTNLHLGYGSPSRLVPDGITFFILPLLQDGGIDFSWIEGFRRL